MRKEIIKEKLSEVKEILEPIFEDNGVTYGYTSDNFTISVYNIYEVRSVTFNIKALDYELIKIAKAIRTALFDAEYVTVRDRTMIENKVEDFISCNGMLGENCWIDIRQGLLTVTDKDGEVFEIDLANEELFIQDIIDEDDFDLAYLHLEDDEIMCFITKNYKDEVECEVSFLEDICDEEDYPSDQDYIKELEVLVAKQSKLIDLLERSQFKNSICKNLMD